VGEGAGGCLDQVEGGGGGERPGSRSAGKEGATRRSPGIDNSQEVGPGWSVCRVGLAPTGKRRLVTAHTHNRPSGSREHGDSPLRQASQAQAGDEEFQKFWCRKVSVLAIAGDAPELDLQAEQKLSNM
jgi:hypothetical protein